VNLLHERPLAERSPQGEEHLVEVERFGDVIVRAEFHGLDRGLAPAIRRDDDHGHVFDAFGVPREDRETVPLRQLQIEQCGGDGRIGERLGRRIAVRRFADDIPSERNSSARLERVAASSSATRIAAFTTGPPGSRACEDERRARDATGIEFDIAIVPPGDFAAQGESSPAPSGRVE